MFKLAMLKRFGRGNAAMSTDFRCSSGAVFGGDGMLGLIACCLMAAKLS